MVDTNPSREKPVALVIDDDMTIRVLVRRALEIAGFSVEEAEDGVSGLSAVESVRPDIILLDVRLPGMDGFDACAGIRMLPHAKTIPVLMMTGLEDEETRNRALEVGATDVIGKPMKLMELGHRARSLLGSGSSPPGQS